MWPIKISKLLIIGSDPVLAEKVCRHFRRPGIYLPFLDPPKKRLEKYGVFKRDLTLTLNVIAQCQSEQILIIGYDEQDLLLKIQEQFPLKQVFHLEEYNINFLSSCLGFQKEGRSSVLYTSLDNLPKNKTWIVIENHHDIQTVIGRNLAIADSSEILIIPNISKVDLENIENIIRSCDSEDPLEKQNYRKSLFDLIETSLPNLIQSKPKNVTFFTLGVPYGLYPFNFPVSHLFVFPHLGISILRGMLKSSKFFLRSPVVIIFDPNTLENTEFSTLCSIYKKNNYAIRKCVGEKAKVRDAHFLTMAMPSDFIFYSTHCGELTGRRITEGFVVRP